MNTSDYIRQAAIKGGWKKYYLLMRPVSIGTQPKGMMDYINYDNRVDIDGHMVWAEVYYERELTKKELADYEMIRG